MRAVELFFQKQGDDLHSHVFPHEPRDPVAFDFVATDLPRFLYHSMPKARLKVTTCCFKLLLMLLFVCR